MSVAAFPQPKAFPAAPGSAALESLLLITDELTVTLNEVRVALEEYAEGNTSNQPLERCAALLHTARGLCRLLRPGVQAC